MATVEFDMREFKEFFRRMERAVKGDFKKEFELFLEGVGFDFLRVVQDEIERRKVLDSRLLLASFEKGADGNVWELTDGGLTLEVGTNVEYANWVEKGHAQQPGRFIPGYWTGPPEDESAKFIYDRNADSGMVLKERYVNGKHYFESALRIYNRIFKAEAEVKLKEWIDKYFCG